MSDSAPSDRSDYDRESRLHPELPDDRYNVYHHPDWFGLEELYVFEVETRTTHYTAGLWREFETGRLYFASRQQSAEWAAYHPLANLRGRKDLEAIEGGVEPIERALKALPRKAHYHRAALVSQAKILLGQEVVYEDVAPLYEREEPEAEALADRLLAGRPFPARPSREHRSRYDVYQHPEYFDLEPVALLHGSASVCQGFDKLGVWARPNGQLLWGTSSGCPACDMAAPFRGYKPDSLEELTPLTAKRWERFVDKVMRVNNLSQKHRFRALVRVSQRLSRKRLADLLEQMLGADRQQTRQLGIRLSRYLEDGPSEGEAQSPGLHQGKYRPRWS